MNEEKRVRIKQRWTDRGLTHEVEYEDDDGKTVKFLTIDFETPEGAWGLDRCLNYLAGSLKPKPLPLCTLRTAD